MHKRENDYLLLKAFMNICKVLLSPLISLPFWILSQGQLIEKPMFPLNVSTRSQLGRRHVQCCGFTQKILPLIADWIFISHGLISWALMHFVCFYMWAWLCLCVSVFYVLKKSAGIRLCRPAFLSPQLWLSGLVKGRGSNVPAALTTVWSCGREMKRER